MPKAPTQIAGIKRAEPRRRMSKQQALRHLIHSAVRVIAAREDPFAIHLVVQSADKLLIDLSRKHGKLLALGWTDNIKEEYRSPLMTVFRETYNFLKHADADHDEMLTLVRLPRAMYFNLPSPAPTTIHSTGNGPII